MKKHGLSLMFGSLFLILFLFIGIGTIQAEATNRVTCIDYKLYFNHARQIPDTPTYGEVNYGIGPVADDFLKNNRSCLSAYGEMLYYKINGNYTPISAWGYDLSAPELALPITESEVVFHCLMVRVKDQYEYDMTDDTTKPTLVINELAVNYDVYTTKEQALASTSEFSMVMDASNPHVCYIFYRWGTLAEIRQKISAPSLPTVSVPNVLPFTEEDGETELTWSGICDKINQKAANVDASATDKAEEKAEQKTEQPYFVKVNLSAVSKVIPREVLLAICGKNVAFHVQLGQGIAVTLYGMNALMDFPIVDLSFKIEDEATGNQCKRSITFTPITGSTLQVQKDTVLHAYLPESLIGETATVYAVQSDGTRTVIAANPVSENHSVCWNVQDELTYEIEYSKQ